MCMYEYIYIYVPYSLSMIEFRDFCMKGKVNFAQLVLQRGLRTPMLESVSPRRYEIVALHSPCSQKPSESTNDPSTRPQSMFWLAISQMIISDGGGINEE